MKITRTQKKLQPATWRPALSGSAKLIVTLLLVSGCSTDKGAQIRQMAAERIASFKKEEMIVCRTRLMEDAERMVDSLLLAEAKAEVLDSLNRTRPSRPAPPIPTEPIDSAEIKPIFEEEQ